METLGDTVKMLTADTTACSPGDATGQSDFRWQAQVKRGNPQ